MWGHFWEFGPHILGADSWVVVQSLGIPFCGVMYQEKWWRANFHRPGKQSQNFGLCQNGENRFAINFLIVHPPKMVWRLIVAQKTSWLPKYGGQTPSITYLASPPVFVQTHRNSCVVHKHAFDCQIRNTGSSAPIFCMQSCQGIYLCRAHRPGESGR